MLNVKKKLSMLVALSGLSLTLPAQADVIMPGPPLAPIKLTEAQVRGMVKAARSAASDIFDFTKADRPEYLNVAYRAAGTKHIVAIQKILSVNIIGERAFILAVVSRYLAPQVVGDDHAYMQCIFDEHGRVIAIGVDI